MSILDLKHEIENKLSNNSFFLNHCFIVGGFVRDILMNKEPKDMDIVVDEEHGSLKLALKIHQAFKSETISPRRLGKYPIWQITFIDGKYKGTSLEIAETMSETFPDKFSRQRLTKYSDLKADIFRRDFTINSLLMKFCKDETINSIIDISQYGIDDILTNHVIRCIPSINAEKILSADPLRILRGIRFSIRFGWEIEKNTFDAMKNVKDRINILSAERIRNELEIISQYPKGLMKCILILNKLDALKIIFPEVDHLKTIIQAPDERNIHLEGSEFYCKNFVQK